MQTSRWLPLAVALLMLPQVAQTLYSPALAGVASAFAIPPDTAAQIMSVYFLGFAVGVVGWGWACDRIGRRPAMLGGLALYATGSAMALFAMTFGGLLAAQATAAVGAAAGSVVTQTMLRDRYAGAELAKVFSVAAMVLAVGPAIGLFVGGALVQAYGYKGVLACVLGLSALLLGWSAMGLPETRAGTHAPSPLAGTLGLMLRDGRLWRSAWLVAIFNVAMFNYYALGPFVFQRLHLGIEAYGCSGVVLALGSSAGAWLNRRLLKAGFAGERLLEVAAVLVLAGGLGVRATQTTLWFLLPMLSVVVAFGLAIPNVLGHALVAYRERLGAAGAVFGLMYYLLIGGGMMLSARTQALGMNLIACGALATALCIAGRRNY